MRIPRWLAPVPRSSSRRRPTMSLDGGLIGAVIILAVSTTASVLVPPLHVRVVAPALDLVLDTLSTVVTLSVALLGWARFRERPEPMAVFQSAACRDGWPRAWSTGSSRRPGERGRRTIRRWPA